jgi:aromatic-L-amino-acid decarboxylase
MKNYQKILNNEQSLDSKDWQQMRQLGKQMIDDMVDYLETISKKPVWQPIPEEVKKTFKTDLPKEGQPLNEIYQEFCQNILPYNCGNIHPRFWGWVQGNGTLTGAFADFLASTMNPNNNKGEVAPMYVDAQVINWSKEMLGFPKTASGILLSGCSMANITGLLVARNSYEDLNARKIGLKNISKQMIIYCSTETHNSTEKAAEAIGIGSNNIRKIAVNDDYQIRTDLLEDAIIKDKNAGLIPLCVVGNCGTVNTGAIDDLKTIAAICKKEKVWFHIDGAFGAIAKLTDEFKDQLKPLEAADSIAFDFHKWMQVNYEVGCLLVRDSKKHRDAFTVPASYLLTHERGLSAGPEPINHFGMELSRNFKALKIWMTLKENGINKFKKLVRQNIAQAYYLADLIRQEDDLELMNIPVLNITCYRYNPKNRKLDIAELNQLNRELLMRLHEQGIVAPSYTILKGNYTIRACITNHRSTKNDFKLLVQESLKIGKEISSDLLV